MYIIDNIQISYLVGLPSGNVHFKVVKILKCENPSFVKFTMDTVKPIKDTQGNLKM